MWGVYRQPRSSLRVLTWSRGQTQFNLRLRAPCKGFKHWPVTSTCGTGLKKSLFPTLMAQSRSQMCLGMFSLSLGMTGPSLELQICFKRLRRTATKYFTWLPGLSGKLNLLKITSSTSGSKASLSHRDPWYNLRIVWCAASTERLSSRSPKFLRLHHWAIYGIFSLKVWTLFMPAWETGKRTQLVIEKLGFQMARFL